MPPSDAVKFGDYAMTRSAFVVGLLLLLLLGGTAGPGLAQEGGWLGAEVASARGTSYDFSTMQSSSYSGSRVEGVLADSPAAAAGFKVGDIILSVDGRQAEDVEQLLDMLRQMSPGSAVRVRIKRDDAYLDLNVVLGKRPASN